MSMLRTLLPLTYRPLVTWNRARRLAHVGRAGGRLRVLLFHDIAPGERTRFQEMLEWLTERWMFIGPDRFIDLLTGKIVTDTDSLLLTFDDGFKSNCIVAEEVLNPMGIPALFFVISSFAELEDPAQQRRFVVERLYPATEAARPTEKRIPRMTNMSYADLRYLVETGHTIGAHTATHARLSEIADERTLVEEIVDSADRLGERLGVAIEHFAFTFGNLVSFSPAALWIARARFPYVYTGMRGDNNVGGVPPWAIRRDALHPNDALRLIGAFTEGAADWRYKRDLETYESWGATAPAISTSRNR